MHVLYLQNLDSNESTEHAQFHNKKQEICSRWRSRDDFYTSSSFWSHLSLFVFILINFVCFCVSMRDMQIIWVSSESEVRIRGEFAVGLKWVFDRKRQHGVVEHNWSEENEDCKSKSQTWKGSSKHQLRIFMLFTAHSKLNILTAIIKSVNVTANKSKFIELYIISQHICTSFVFCLIQSVLDHFF